MVRVLGASEMASAGEVVKSGGIIAYPTDTVYGLGCDPWSEPAVDRLFAAKGRENRPIPVLCSKLDAARAVVELNECALELARAHWPGALTIVAPLKRAVPSKLDQGSGWLGVRVPAHAIALSLAREVGGYISGTSANLSGRPSCRTANEVSQSMDDRIDAILDGGPTHGGESTVVKVIGSSIEVLRRGSISFESGITPERSRT